MWVNDYLKLIISIRIPAHTMKRFGVCFKLEIVKNMVKAKGAGRFGWLANVGCADANGKVQTSCSVAVWCQIYLFCMRSHVSVFVCNNYVFVFGFGLGAICIYLDS